MKYGSRFDELRTLLPQWPTCCIKPSHLCEGYGVVLLRNNVVRNEIKSPFRIPVPTPLGKNVEDEHETIVRFFEKICSTPITTDERQAFCRTVSAQVAEPGVVVEELVEVACEIKIFVIEGTIELFYYLLPPNPLLFGNRTFSFQKNHNLPPLDKNMKAACYIIANELGVPAIRIDLVVRLDGTWFVGELTFEPTILAYLGIGPGYSGVKRRFEDAYHRHCGAQCSRSVVVGTLPTKKKYG